ncbi:MAG: hypothetical protein FK732_11595 [Asgard group archaeon]|nr:hypothetical protein [Asgard group archaeon]
MEKTYLENACSEIIGKNYNNYYDILSNLLLLNPDFIQKSDPRLSAKVTAILFDDRLKEKPHLICEFIENPELNMEFNVQEIKYTKRLLDLDPELTNTSMIIDLLKQNIITEDHSHILSLLVKEDMEKLSFSERARFIHKF